MRTLLIAVWLMLLSFGGSAYADYQGPNLKMPLPGGYQWLVTVPVGGVWGSCGSECTDHWHTNAKNGYFAIDFDNSIKVGNSFEHEVGGSGSVDVLAAADGYVVGAVNTGCSQYGTTCKVVIDHGNGYRTTYLHLAAGSLQVEVRTPPAQLQFVKQGQVLGKLGTTGDSNGTHLHFEIDHLGESLSSTPELSGVTLDGLPFASYNVGQYYSSTNGLTYSPTNNPQTCGDQPTGGQSTNWIYSCTDQRTTFAANENVHGLIRINDVTMDYRTKVELWKGTVKQWEEVGSWNDVDPVWGWDHAFWWYFHHNVSLYGNLELRYFIDTGSGFLPAPFAKKSFTVNAPALYTYDGNGFMCGDQPTTSGQSSNWWYFCTDARLNYNQGETIFGLVRINDVYADFTFKVEAWKNGVLQWSWADAKRYIDPVWGWDHAFFWPSLSNASVGTWQFKYFVDVGSGFGASFAQKTFYVQ